MALNKTFEVVSLALACYTQLNFSFEKNYFIYIHTIMGSEISQSDPSVISFVKLISVRHPSRVSGRVDQTQWFIKLGGSSAYVNL